MDNRLLLGVGREIITPPLGTFLAGYGSSGRDAVAVHDDLTVTAFYFCSADAKAMLISATLNLIDEEIADMLKTRIEEETGIPGAHILVHATHTHSSPLTFSTNGWGTPNWSYVNSIFLPQAVSAAKKAKNGSVSVKMAVSIGESLVGINRRQLNGENKIILGQCDYGCFDPKMTVISFADDAGNCVANLVHYGCHATGAGSNLEITRDWPGVMTDRLEVISGGVAAFFNGPEGDVGPRLTNGRTTGAKDISYAMEHGAVAAADAVRIYRKAAAYHNAQLQCVERVIKLPVDPRISYEEARHRLDTVDDPNPQHAERIRMHYREILDSYESGYTEHTHAEFTQTALKIGDVVFVTYPFELFSEIGLRVQKASSLPFVLNLALTNGCESYFPTKGEIARGGYEVKAFKTERIQPLSDDADFALVQETLKTLQLLAQ